MAVTHKKACNRRPFSLPFGYFYGGVMDQNEDQEKPAIINETVDPKEAGWATRMLYKTHFKYRVFFRNGTDLANSLRLMAVKELFEEMPEQVGYENTDWVLEDAVEPVGAGGSKVVQEEDKLWGPCVYLTDMSWLVTLKLTENGTEKSILDVVTVIQTRAE